jgi:molybdopterin-guanine dinucleotide biosynthesis protein A
MTAAGRPHLLGAVLAGGASTRFGAPKWRVQLAGQTLGERAVAALRPSTAQVVAISSDPEVASLGVEVRADLVAGQGPLGGIRTALVWAAERSLAGAFVLACDLPLVTAPLVQALVSAWQGSDAVVTVGPAGSEPLCALYSLTALPRIESALERGELSPSRLLMSELEVHRLAMEVARDASGIQAPFLNVNTRADWELAEELLRRTPRSGLAGSADAYHM